MATRVDLPAGLDFTPGGIENFGLGPTQGPFQVNPNFRTTPDAPSFKIGEQQAVRGVAENINTSPTAETVIEQIVGGVVGGAATGATRGDRPAAQPTGSRPSTGGGQRRLILPISGHGGTVQYYDPASDPWINLLNRLPRPLAKALELLFGRTLEERLTGSLLIGGPLQLKVNPLTGTSLFGVGIKARLEEFSFLFKESLPDLPPGIEDPRQLLRFVQYRLDEFRRIGAAQLGRAAPFVEEIIQRGTGGVEVIPPTTRGPVPQRELQPILEFLKRIVRGIEPFGP